MRKIMKIVFVILFVLTNITMVCAKNEHSLSQIEVQAMDTVFDKVDATIRLQIMVSGNGFWLSGYTSLNKSLAEDVQFYVNGWITSSGSSYYFSGYMTVKAGSVNSMPQNLSNTCSGIPRDVKVDMVRAMPNTSIGNISVVFD